MRQMSRYKSRPNDQVSGNAGCKVRQRVGRRATHAALEAEHLLQKQSFFWIEDWLGRESREGKIQMQDKSNTLDGGLIVTTLASRAKKKKANRRNLGDHGNLKKGCPLDCRPTPLLLFVANGLFFTAYSESSSSLSAFSSHSLNFSADLRTFLLTFKSTYFLLALAHHILRTSSVIRSFS